MTLSALVAQPADTRPTAVKITLAVVSRSDVWAGALVATVVPFCYMLLWWNRYLAPNSCGELLMMGTHSFDLLPYRDYQYQSPPGMPLFLGWLGAVFGPRLVVPWFIGVAAQHRGRFRPVLSAVGHRAALRRGGGDHRHDGGRHGRPGGDAVHVQPHDR